MNVGEMTEVKELLLRSCPMIKLGFGEKQGSKAMIITNLFFTLQEKIGGILLGGYNKRKLCIYQTTIFQRTKKKLLLL
jgi:hypothetical protein